MEVKEEKGGDRGGGGDRGVEVEEAVKVEEVEESTLLTCTCSPALRKLLGLFFSLPLIKTQMGHRH